MSDYQPVPGIRASDADRAHTAAVVQAAMSRGMLTFAEGDQRLAGVYAARFRHELVALTADLPEQGLHPAAATGCTACGAGLTSPAQLALTAARLAVARVAASPSRAAAIAIPALLITMFVVAAIGWGALHELLADHGRGFGEH